MAVDGDPPLRVVRVTRSAVVPAWRSRDRALRELDVDLVLVSARRWDEGGRTLTLERADDVYIVPAATIGRHPNAFLYDPRPIWRTLSPDVDVLDVHEEPCSLAAAEIRLLRWFRARRSRLVLYSAQNIMKRYPWPFRWFERAALRDASAVYACNEAAADILRRKGFDGQLEVLPLGIEGAAFTGPERGSSGGDGRRADGTDLRIGYVGRLERFKGVQVVLEAMRTEPAWRFEIIGDGPHRGALQELAQASGVGDRAHFRGFVPNEQLPACYRSFDVVVVPSLPTPSWEEQFCRVAVEAMASGVPVVASDSGALPEVVGDGGVLVPPDDPSALREALAGLASDPAARAALGDRARFRAQGFEWAAIARRQRDLYQRVLA